MDDFGEEKGRLFQLALNSADEFRLQLMGFHLDADKAGS
jgi:hypothetical protein